MRWMLAMAAMAMLATTVMANGLGLYGSYWKPEDMENAWGAGAKMQVEVVPSIYVEARAGYFHEIEAEDVEDEGAPKLNVVPLELAGILKFPVDQITPYAGAGAGYYMFDVADEPEGVSITVDDKIGYFAVAGVELALSDNASLFGEAKYTWLDEVDVEAKAGGTTLKDKGDLSGFGANVGLLLKW
jgi:opacity protein-like surface antigen